MEPRLEQGVRCELQHLHHVVRCMNVMKILKRDTSWIDISDFHIIDRFSIMR